MDREVILEVKNLKQYFKIDRKNTIKAVDDISFNVYKGEIFGLVGESGSGKSTLGRSIIGINKLTAGSIIFEGINIGIRKVYNKERKKINKDMQFIFQDSTSSLNSRMTIGEIIEEPIKIQKLCKDKEERVQLVYNLMKTVGLDKEYFYRYPYDFSGGQRQKTGIARALGVKPKLIIADEPIASLDVSMQAQIVNLFKKLKKEEGLTCIFIAHDLSMVRHISDRIGVMYNGRLVEVAEAKELYKNPVHPYTKSLINSILRANPNHKTIFTDQIYKENSYTHRKEKSKLREINKNHFVYCSDNEYALYREPSKQ